MPRGEKDYRWPHVRVWLWTDKSGRPRFSFDRVQRVKSQTFEMPRDPESLMALVNATRGALRELTGLDDPEEARILLRKQIYENKEREAEKKRREAAESAARGWRRDPVDAPLTPEASESIRTLSGGLPTLGRRRH